MVYKLDIGVLLHRGVVRYRLEGGERQAVWPENNFNINQIDRDNHHHHHVHEGLGVFPVP
jgi:hypothetical protein